MSTYYDDLCEDRAAVLNQEEISLLVKGGLGDPSEQVPVVSAVSTDSRRIVPGSLFPGWGEKFDGHLFIDAALVSPLLLGACAPSCPRISGRISFTSR